VELRPALTKPWFAQAAADQFHGSLQTPPERVAGKMTLVTDTRIEVMKRYQMWICIGSLFGLMAVACGAFGAHGLKALLSTNGALAEEAQKQLANWETAARYQMYHALALVAVGLLALRCRSRALNIAGAAMTAGTIIFSGCLYLLVLTGQKWLGAIVPIGGVLLLVGWAALIPAAMKIAPLEQRD